MIKIYNWGRKKVYIALILLIVVILIGVLGFRFFSDYSWIDALYMTVITMSTVGFSEVHPLDENAKLFTIFLIATSVSIFAYSVSVITDYIVSKNDPKRVQYRKIQKMIHKLENHIIIIGYGRNGKQSAVKLLAYNKPFIIIEKDDEIIERYQNDQLLFLKGNATEDQVLIEAGIKNAACLICTLPEDADNLFIVLSARQINKKLKIISRASEDASYKKIRLAGADNVIMPDRIGGDHMASLVVVPDLIEFLDNLSIVGKRSINIEEVSFEDMFDDHQERTILNIDMRSRTGCTIIGYKSPNGEYIVNPEASTVLKPGSKVVVLGRPEQINLLNKEFNI
ncbi:potassium channel protein [Aquimarina sp. AD10]|uniref:Potassium transporter TrkA n=1 Tax=Aquimarina aggregata TaxID=1642818 RepID=A0A163BAT2_9FLAO|nr:MULTISPECIES: potassium channel protein [Aquimarina]AXT60707.1 potassium channel protein [Aquimarina sp. AD10]KZS41197.1 potassium transporter TrkA [Aquimarina aggregata]RKM95734.1 potassium channel protein [Aquimarina sp. AD10]